MWRSGAAPVHGFCSDALRDQIFRRQNKDGATEVVLGKTRTLKNAGCGTRDVC